MVSEFQFILRSCYKLPVSKIGWDRHFVYNKFLMIYKIILPCTQYLANNNHSITVSYKSAVPKTRAPDKVRIFISKMSIPSQNPMFDHFLESSHRDDSNKWSNIGFGEEIK